MSNALRITTEQYQALNAKKDKRRVRGTKRKVVNGIEFDSTREARRYQDLCLMQDGDRIADLRRQVAFKIQINGIHICEWFADFTYKTYDYDTEQWRTTVEDCKGWKTDVYKLKKKLVEAQYGIKILET